MKTQVSRPVIVYYIKLNTGSDSEATIDLVMPNYFYLTVLSFYSSVS